jgi:UDP-2,3-diacylglucosamine pyrophosphatase LpxH
MRVVMVSDVHLEGLNDPVQRDFVRWLDALEADELFMLGDVFHHWWGFSGAVMTPYVPVCAALLRLRERGVGITFVPGNHDFRAGPFFTEVLGAEVRAMHLRQVQGRSVFLAHGDEADTSAGYALTRWALRSWAFDGFVRLLGAGWAWRFLRRLAGRSRAQPADQRALLARQRRWAQTKLTEGNELVVLGHVHHMGIHRTGVGAVIHLGGWCDERSWLDWSEAGIWLSQGAPDAPERVEAL